MNARDRVKPKEAFLLKPRAILALFLPFALCAQSGGGLRILVLQGEGAVNNLQTKRGTPPVVEIQDENGHPVVEATVIFRVPPTGASAFFEGRQTELKTRSDFRGQAAPGAYAPNGSDGRFVISVSATSGALTGEAVITQTNSNNMFASETAAKKSGWFSGWKRWAIIGGAAAGTGLGVYLGTRGGGSNNGVVIAPGGGVVIGAPR